jgi:excisionase family DNA binding protein
MDVNISTVAVERLANIENLLVELIKNQSSTTTSPPPRDIITVPEAAKFLKRSNANIYELASKRLIPHSKLFGKQLLFSVKELTELIKKNKVPTIDEMNIEADQFLSQKKKKNIR